MDVEQRGTWSRSPRRAVGRPPWLALGTSCNAMVVLLKRSYITHGQKFQKVENDENRFFAITSSKLFKN